MYFYYQWWVECHDPDKDIKCFNLLDQTPFIFVLYCRLFVIAYKYGKYSNEHMDILRKVYLPMELTDYLLAINKSNDDKIESHLININEIMQSMKINE